jgi:peptidoglycan-N-acetylglucosamine deacetylase
VSPRRSLALAALLILAAAYLGYREFLHAGTLLVPAIITRDMNARAAVSPGILRRATRLVGGSAPLADRPKLIALTFDDGPYPVSTPLLLDELHDLHVPATFFLIGHTGREFPQLARRIVAARDQIANHTLTHPNLEHLNPSAIRAQLADAARILQRYTRDPSPSSMMRPPGGRYTVQTIADVQRDGYDVILWNDDPGDWEGFSAGEMLRHIEQKATAPEILLLHSGILPTIQMLPQLVNRYRAAGYTFVTIEQLLARTSVTALNDPARDPL